MCEKHKKLITKNIQKLANYATSEFEIKKLSERASQSSSRSRSIFTKIFNRSIKNHQVRLILKKETPYESQTPYEGSNARVNSNLPTKVTRSIQEKTKIRINQVQRSIRAYEHIVK